MYLDINLLDALRGVEERDSAQERIFFWISIFSISSLSIFNEDRSASVSLCNSFNFLKSWRAFVEISSFSSFTIESSSCKRSKEDSIPAVSPSLLFKAALKLRISVFCSFTWSARICDWEERRRISAWRWKKSQKKKEKVRKSQEKKEKSETKWRFEDW